MKARNLNHMNATSLLLLWAVTIALCVAVLFQNYQQDKQNQSFFQVRTAQINTQTSIILCVMQQEVSDRTDQLIANCRAENGNP